MEKLTQFIEKLLVPLANKLSANKFLAAISGGFSVLLPITMVGAIFTLLANLQIGVYQNFITAIHFKEIFSFAPKVTTDMLALYAVFLIGKALADKLGLEKESTIVGALSLFSFLLMIPLGVSGAGAQSKEVVEIAAAVGTKWLGSAGLFSAMIIGLIVPVIYNFFIQHHITIKMPEQVPPTISKSFSALIPAFAIAFIFGSVRLGFSLTSFGSVNQFIYSMLQAPLTSLGASPFTYIIFIIMCSMMWFFGLHGGMIVNPFLALLYTSASLENLEAIAAGSAPQNLITTSTWSTFASLGGAGGTIGLCIIMVFFAKSSRYKSLGRIALPSGLCGINEPITFGMPMVLNAIMLIPFVITPIITFLIAYVCMSTGLVPLLNGVAIPLGTPVIFSGLVAGSWQTAVLQVFLILVQIAIYLPFFKVLDKRELEMEQNSEQE